MDGIFWGVPKGEKLLLSDAVDFFFRTHTAEEIKNAIPPFNKVPEVARQAVQTERFGRIQVSEYVNIVDREAGEQMAAMFFWLDDTTAYAAFRGTDDTITGWKEDFSMSYLEETPGQKEAVEWLNTAFSRADAEARRQSGETSEAAPLRLYTGGHSKGGNFAIYASAFAEKNVRDAIAAVYSNDGPGFRTEITENEDYAGMLPRVVRILPESSLIGGLLETGAHTLVIKSSQNGLLQHDALSWEVLGTEFVPAERSAMGRFFDETVGTWLAGLEDTERIRFTNALFDMLEAGGAATVDDLRANPARTVSEMVKASRDMSADAKKEFGDVLMQLLAAGAGTFKDQARQLTQKTYREVRSIIKSEG